MIESVNPVDIEINSPFHPGEQAAQQRLGVRDSIQAFASQAIRDYMPDQHRKFFSELPFMVVAAKDGQGRPWATMLTGEPGFVQSPEHRSLTLNASPVAGDALEHAFFQGATLGLLGINLDTRRRNRINGTVNNIDKSGLTIGVDQSFGNCPQYISKRFWKNSNTEKDNVRSTRLRQLTPILQSWVETADTMFIGSGYSNQKDGEQGMDVSHRGGPAGFVKVLNNKQLVIPDYAGNNFFNTIGNLMMDPGIGLLFVDFDNGSLLQVTGHATIDWDSDQIINHSGAKRLINVDIEQIVHLENALPLKWSAPENPTRELKLIDKIPESHNVTSFIFAARDGGKLADFKAGQYLPIELTLNQHDFIARTYSLSNSPGQGVYRISVKREHKGQVSGYLHDSINPNDIIVSKLPEGDFVLKHSDRPVVLASVGIGITPMVSMLNELAGGKNPVYFFHGARNSNFSPLSDEIRKLAKQNSNIVLNFYFSQPLQEDQAGTHYDQIGRLDVEGIRRIVPDLDAEFYLCGPTSFLSNVETQLIQRGVKQTDIHTESF